MGLMIRRVLVVGSVICILAVSSFFGIRRYLSWGRTVIYPETSTLSKYPGSGEIVRKVDRTIFIVPIIIGRSFYVKPEFKSVYENSPDKYQVFDIYPQNELLYSVGIFDRWEDISDSMDKYLVVKYPNSNEVKKYRIAFQNSELFGDNPTSLGIEDTSYRYNGKSENSVVRAFPGNLIDFTFNRLSQIILHNDVVIINKIPNPPILSVQDQNGYYLASWITIRRIGGKKTLDHEIKI